jgi:hypothetical protein
MADRAPLGETRVERTGEVEVIRLARAGRAWAVKHRGGFLGHANSLEEASFIGRDLVSWFASQGRPAELVVGETAEVAAVRVVG